jgi:hypothetical protein
VFRVGAHGDDRPAGARVVGGGSGGASGLDHLDVASVKFQHRPPGVEARVHAGSQCIVVAGGDRPRGAVSGVRQPPHRVQHSRVALRVAVA